MTCMSSYSCFVSICFPVLSLFLAVVRLSISRSSLYFSLSTSLPLSMHVPWRWRNATPNKGIQKLR